MNKRRILRYVLAGSAVVVFTGYFAFSTFLYAPFESDYDYDVSTLIPRDVDFYVSKARLADDFEEFPQLAVASAVRESASGRRVVDSRPWREFMAEHEVEQALNEVRDALEQLPVSIDPLSVLGGEDVALAGYFNGPNTGDARWAVYGRTNWMGKLGLALLGYPGLLGLGEQGITVAEEDGVISLSGGQLTRPIHLARVLDVFVAGSDADLVQQALALDAKTGADSFGQSARYADHIDRPEREGDEIELFLDTLTMRDELRIAGTWPDPHSEDFLPAFLGRLFQLGAVKELVGIGSFDRGAHLELRGEFSSELTTASQKKVYRTRHFDKDTMLKNIVPYAPRDAGLVVYMHADIEELLMMALQALDSSTLSLLEDLVREVWGYGSAETLVMDFDAAFKDRIGIVVRPNDYPPDPNGPPHNDDPVPAWGLLLWIDDVGKVEQLQQKIIDRQNYFGIQGREPGSPGVFKNTVEGGNVVHEFWSQQIPGTGHIATGQSEDVFLISNSFRMLAQMITTKYRVEQPSLAQNPIFQDLLFSGMDHSTLAVWLNPRSLAPYLREVSRWSAEGAVNLDLRGERARLQILALREDYGGKRLEDLTSDEATSLELLIDRRLKELLDNVRAQQVPALIAANNEKIDMLEALAGGLLRLALNPKYVELSLGTRVPLD